MSFTFFPQVTKQATEFISTFEVSDAKLMLTIPDVIEGPREARILYMEILLLKQFSRMETDPGSAQLVSDMKALVTRLNIFVSSNQLRIGHSDLRSGLWQAAQNVGQGN